MTFLLVFPHAYALTVPVRATLTEWVEPGERPFAADTARTAEVRVATSDLSTSFPVSGDELVADLRTASGEGLAAFDGDPAGSIRTWAVYYLDAEGNVLGDAEIVDILFSDRGYGGIASAATRYRRTSALTVKPKNSNTGEGWQHSDRSAYSVSVSVQDAGTAATWVGIQELRNDGDGNGLVDAADLDVMTLGAYATYQGLALDAIVPLDTFSVRVDGEIEVEGLSVDGSGTVEGGQELRWDVGFAIPSMRNATLAVTYEEAIGKVKRRAGTAQRVALGADDLLVESWDATATVSLPGDFRAFEVSGLLATGTETLEGMALRPISATVRATVPLVFTRVQVERGYDIVVADVQDGSWTDLSDLLSSGVEVSFPELRVVVSDGNGDTVAESLCQLHPTAGTTEGFAARDVLVGECVAADGGVEVRRVRVAVDETGAGQLAVDLAGAAFAAEREAVPCYSRVCDVTVEEHQVLGGGTVTISAAGGATFRTSAMEVRETDFELPFVFDEDPSDIEAMLEVALTVPPSEETVIWRLQDDGVLVSSAGAMLDPEHVDVTGSATVAFKGKEEVIATVEAGTPTLAMRIDRMTVRAARAREAASEIVISGW